MLNPKVTDALWQNVLRPYLFRKEAEGAHVFTVRNLVRIQKSPFLPLLKYMYSSPYADMPVSVGGIPWLNPVGIAAGFDKQGEVIAACEALGIGSLEVGTVTPRPQRGNEPPRVFRYPEHLAIVNRYGFNSDGAEAVAKRLSHTFSHYKIGMPVGVSIGKNKDTPDEKAVDDYVEAYRMLRPEMRKNDYVKINISSPNTPQLRMIFERLDDFLRSFMERAGNVLSEHPLPIFYLKLPPDGLSKEDLASVVRIAHEHGIKAIECTNTTTDKTVKEYYKITEEGGLSGAPLFGLSNHTLIEIRDVAFHQNMDLIGVGGILSGENAVTKFELGRRQVKALQCYTGLVFRGPMLIHECLQALHEERFQIGIE